MTTRTKAGGASESFSLTSPSESVYAVIVTYKDRSALLKQVVNALTTEGVRRIVLVSNGARWDIESWARQEAAGLVHLVHLSSNEGSAPGFAAGIERAIKCGAEFLWLLDDDNKPEPGALEALLGAYHQLATGSRREQLAVAAFRPRRFAGVFRDVPLSRHIQPPSSFLGFHLGEVPLVLWRHFRWGRPGPRKHIPALIERYVAPYGGLLFHRAVVDAHGLPRADFVVYGDDWEFTSRITRSGGTIQLVTSARIDEIDEPGTAKPRHVTPFANWFIWEDWRAFYGARNHAYVETHCLPRTRVMFYANRCLCQGILWVHSLAFPRAGRYRLLRSAIRDGTAGRMGPVRGLELEQ